jgi:hypothetical protein
MAKLVLYTGGVLLTLSMLASAYELIPQEDKDAFWKSEVPPNQPDPMNQEFG